jgi:hypothetical protein
MRQAADKSKGQRGWPGTGWNKTELVGVVEGLVNRGLPFHTFCGILIEFKTENNSYW